MGKLSILCSLRASELTSETKISKPRYPVCSLRGRSVNLAWPLSGDTTLHVSFLALGLRLDWVSVYCNTYFRGVIFNCRQSGTDISKSCKHNSVFRGVDAHSHRTSRIMCPRSQRELLTPHMKWGYQPTNKVRFKVPQGRELI